MHANVHKLPIKIYLQVPKKKIYLQDNKKSLLEKHGQYPLIKKSAFKA